jgi:hypothetical protein
MEAGMNKGLDDYIEKLRAEGKVRSIDPAIMAEYERQMREETIPKIEADIRANAERVRCLIYHPRGCQCCTETEEQADHAP